MPVSVGMWLAPLSLNHWLRYSATGISCFVLQRGCSVVSTTNPSPLCQALGQTLVPDHLIQLNEVSWSPPFTAQRTESSDMHRFVGQARGRAGESPSGQAAEPVS